MFVFNDSSLRTDVLDLARRGGSGQETVERVLGRAKEFEDYVVGDSAENLQVRMRALESAVYDADTSRTDLILDRAKEYANYILNQETTADE